MSKERDDALKVLRDVRLYLDSVAEIADGEGRYRPAWLIHLLQLTAPRSLKGSSPATEKLSAQEWLQRGEPVSGMLAHTAESAPATVSGLTLSAEEVEEVRRALLFLKVDLGYEHRAREALSLLERKR